MICVHFLVIPAASPLVCTPLQAGETPLFLAASRGHVAVARLLLRAGADPERAMRHAAASARPRPPCSTPFAEVRAPASAVPRHLLCSACWLMRTDCLCRRVATRKATGLLQHWRPHRRSERGGQKAGISTEKAGRELGNVSLPAVLHCLLLSSPCTHHSLSHSLRHSPLLAKVGLAPGYRSRASRIC